MALRYGLLAAGAALVLGLGVYLFFEVRARPAAAQVRPEPRAPRASGEAAAAGAEEDRAPARGRAADRRAPAPAPGVGGTRRAIGASERVPPRGPDGEALDPAPHKIDAIMNEANKAYDRGDLDEAKAIARKVLATSPNNVRMLRIVVSASCISGDHAEAQDAFVLLPRFDREQMKLRCGRYGVSFTEP